MDKKLYAKAEESVKSAKVILDDMRANRSQYGAVDLAWRCLDISLVLVEVMDMVLKVVKPEKKSARPSRQKLIDEIVEEEKLSPDEKELNKEKKGKGPDILDPDEKLDAKKKGKKKSSVKPSRPKVVKGNKKKGQRKV